MDKDREWAWLRVRPRVEGYLVVFIKVWVEKWATGWLEARLWAGLKGARCIG